MKAAFTKYPVTFLLVLTNIGLFLVTEFAGGSENVEVMLRFGAAWTPAILAGEWYRLFASMFLHFGIEHIVSNMLSLGVLGQRMETALGHVRFLVVYIAGGLGGNLLSLLVETRQGGYTVSAGASGAVFALIGAMLATLLLDRRRLKDISPRRGILLAALSVYIGFLRPNVDNMAHLGGLITGFLLCILMLLPGRRAE